MEGCILNTIFFLNIKYIKIKYYANLGKGKLDVRSVCSTATS